MTRTGQARPTCLVLLLTLGTATAIPVSALAQPAAKPPEPPKVLIVSPTAAPVPALKYRLLPSFADLNPGDAAPIYLRIRHEMIEEAWKQLSEKPRKWLEVPLQDFPVAEARPFVAMWGNRLKQIEFGAHRKTCDWNYTLPEERLNAIAILLPDAQDMRTWGRLLALKARVEIAEGKFDDAVHTIETGLTFSRHVAAGPFVINGVIGIAIATHMLDRCDELIAQRGAPNLYWALTALPRPLIDMRNELEVEQKLCENLIPELSEAKLARPRGAAEWGSLMARMHERIVKLCRSLIDSQDGTAGLQILSGWDFARFKAETLPTAREYLKTSRKLTDQQVDAMSEDQIVALYITDHHRELWDDHFKASYLPARDAITQLIAAENRFSSAKMGPFVLFVQLLPAVQAGLKAELRLDRRVAALRVIEALRMYAAAHHGSLPESLNQITEVPVPDDPATGKPFEYRCTGNSAILSGPPAGLPPPWPGYRIAIRH
ncbi:MAG: hypothetical protein ACHRXM_04820 [Isosphaerales bacterium]